MVRFISNIAYEARDADCSGYLAFAANAVEIPRFLEYWNREKSVMYSMNYSWPTQLHRYIMVILRFDWHGDVRFTYFSQKNERWYNNSDVSDILKGMWSSLIDWLCLQILLLEALKWNRSDYVQVLLDDGVQLRLQYMRELYSTVHVNTLLKRCTAQI